MSLQAKAGSSEWASWVAQLYPYFEVILEISVWFQIHGPKLLPLHHLLYCRRDVAIVERYLSFFHTYLGFGLGKTDRYFALLPGVLPTDFRWCPLLQKHLVLQICHTSMHKTQLQPFCVLQYKMLLQGCMGSLLLDILTTAFLLCSLDEQSLLEKTCSFLVRVLLPSRGTGQNH